MGVLDPLRRFLQRMAESDEQRLAEEIQDWLVRSRMKVAGVVKRITVRPLEGFESLEALISDGTGELSVLWMGRRSIPGLTLGTRIVVEGVVAEKRGGLKMVNPTFEFAA